MSASTASLKPNWNKLPDTFNLSPRWYERQNVRDAAFKSLTLLGMASLGGAGYTGYTQSAKLPSFFVLLGVAVTSFLVAVRCLTPSIQDPAVALKLRQTAGRDLETSPDLTFAGFFQKYRELLAKNILEPSDATLLLEKDIEQLDYSAFVTKHAGTDVACKKALYKTLAPAYQDRLRTSCRVAFALEPSKAKDEADKEWLGDTPLNPNQEALLAKDWDSLVVKCPEVIPKVTQPQALEALKTLFLAKAYKRETDHERYLHYFPEGVRKDLRDTLHRFELELLADGKLGFEAMIWNRNWEDVRSALGQVDPSKQEALKEKLKKGYLSRISYRDLKSEESSEMRAVLGLTDEVLENMQGSIRTDCDALPYLGDEGFRRKYGNAPLKNNALQPIQLEKIKAELRAALPTAPTISHSLWEDLRILGLREDILKARWEKMSLETIWKDPNEKSSFFEDAESILGAEGLKMKLLIELEKLSIFLILRDYAELFPKFLKPDDRRLDGRTFAAFAEEEVGRAGSFSQEVVPFAYRGSFYALVTTLVGYLPLLFEHSFLSMHSPALRKMLQDFLLKHGKEILEFNGSYETTNIALWKKLQTIPQMMTPALKSAYEMGHAALLAAKAKLKTDKDAVSHSRYEVSAASKGLMEKLTKETSRLAETQSLEREYQDQKWKLLRDLHEKNRVLAEHQQKISAHHSTLQGLPLLQTRLQAQVADLEKQKAPDPAPLIQLTKDLPGIRSRLKAQEQEYEQLLANDPERIRLQQKIDASQALLRQAQKDAGPTSETLGRIEKQIEAIRDKKSWKEKELNPRPSVWSYATRSLRPEEKVSLEKEIADYDQQLSELEHKRSVAAQAHAPFQKKWNDLRLQTAAEEQVLAQYIQELQATKDLNSSREVLRQLEEKQICMAATLEVWNARPQVLEELKRKEKAIDSELEKCKADLDTLEKALPALQAAYQTAKEQNEARDQKEKELKRTITELENSVKQLQSDVNNDPDSKKFYAEKDQKLKELDRQYQEVVQQHMDALLKSVAPEDKAAF